MTPSAYLEALEGRGIRLFLDTSGNLAYRAPKGVMTPSVRANIRQAAPRLLPLLRPKDAAAAAAKDAPPQEAAADNGGVRPLSPEEIAEFRALWEEAEAESEALYRERVRDAYGAAQEGRMPLLPVRLRPGITATDQNRCLLRLVQDGRRLQALHGAAWMDSEDGELIARDIETLAGWWQRYAAEAEALAALSELSEKGSG